MARMPPPSSRLCLADTARSDTGAQRCKRSRPSCPSTLPSGTRLACSPGWCRPGMRPQRLDQSRLETSLGDTPATRRTESHLWCRHSHRSCSSHQGTAGSGSECTCPAWLHRSPPGTALAGTCHDRCTGNRLLSPRTPRHGTGPCRTLHCHRWHTRPFPAARTRGGTGLDPDTSKHNHYGFGRKRSPFALTPVGRRLQSKAALVRAPWL